MIQNSKLSYKTIVLFMLAGYLCHVAADTSYTHYRLPTSIQPESYQLKIITHLENPDNLTFHGEVSIRFKVLEDTNNITLHVQNLTIDETRIQLESYDDEDFHLCLEGVDTVPEQDYYILVLGQTLRKGQMYKVKLDFSGILSEKLYGYYPSSYVDASTNETRWLSATHFEPAAARAAFPCFDEPIYKAKFTIWLGHHEALTAISNMPLEKQIPLAALPDFVWSIFEESVPMSTYLVAYTVNDFTYKESKLEGSNVAFRIWTRRDYSHQCDYTAAVGPSVLKYYEELFGIPFPLKKIDQIALPILRPAGMENWGLVTYRENAFMYAYHLPTRMNKLGITKLIAHELAHQWFGNLVTMKWWNDLWLNEGFATYIASVALHSLMPQYETYNVDALHLFMTMFRRDAKLTSHPISRPVLVTSKIRGVFDSMSYAKGSVILRMMHLLMGHEAFFEGIRDYLTQHMYKNAEQDDLWAAFTEKAHSLQRIGPQHDMKTIMDSWTLQAGYPLVKVSRSPETGSIEITQHRFLENSTLSEDDANQCWWVPLSYTTASEMDFTTTTPKAWLECDESGRNVPMKLDNVTDGSEWVIFNIQLAGFFRIMYDSDNWRHLGDALKSDHFMGIHAMNRAQLIGDVLSLAWSGYHGYDTAFAITDYLVQEREYIPWEAALNALSDMFYLLEPFAQHRAQIQAYMRYILEPVYLYISGMNDTIETNQTIPQIWIKHLVTEWACRVELDECVHTAINYFQQWKLDSAGNKIPADWTNVVYCTVIRRGDADDWSFLWQRYLETKETAIIESLACSRNESLLREYMDVFFNADQLFDKQEAMMVLRALLTSEICAHIAREYFVEHIERSAEYFKVSDVLVALSAHIVSTEELNKFSDVVDSKKEYFKNSESSLQNAFEKIHFNLQWIERNLEDVKSLLQNRLSLLDIGDDDGDNVV